MPNSTTGKCDLVVSLSEDMINRGFTKLFAQGMIQPKIFAVISEDKHQNITTVYNTEDKFNEWQNDFASYIDGTMDGKAFTNKWHTSYGWKAVIKPPTTRIKEAENMLFSINISSDAGASMLYDYSDKDDPDITDLKDVVYAFEVPVARINYDSNNLDVSPALKSKLAVMSVEQLFLSFTEANIMAFDPEISQLQGLEDSITLKAVIAQYYQSLGQQNGHVLGYQISVPQDYSNAVFHPKAIKNSNSVGDSSFEGSFNYVAMTSTSTFPNDNSVGVLSHSLLPTGDKDGVMILSGETFINYLKGQIDPLVSRQCYAPHVRVSLDNGSFPPFTISTNYSWGMNSAQSSQCQVNYTNREALTYTYTAGASDSAGATDDYKMDLESYFDAHLIFSTNSFAIKQHFKVHVGIQVMHGTSDSGDVIDKTYTDTYTLALDETNTKLTWTRSSVSDPGDTKTLGVNDFLNFFTDFSNLANDIAGWANHFTESVFSDSILQFSETSVLPASGAYTFSNPHFDSENNLLVGVAYQGDDS